MYFSFASALRPSRSCPPPAPLRPSCEFWGYLPWWRMMMIHEGGSGGKEEDDTFLIYSLLVVLNFLRVSFLLATRFLFTCPTPSATSHFFFSPRPPAWPICPPPRFFPRPFGLRTFFLAPRLRHCSLPLSHLSNGDSVIYFPSLPPPRRVLFTFLSIRCCWRRFARGVGIYEKGKEVEGEGREDGRNSKRGGSGGGGGGRKWVRRMIRNRQTNY